jgi:hypothetical protein
MPLFNFQCNKCKRTARHIFSVSDSEAYDGSLCFENGCDGRWQRTPTGPTTQVVERLDNTINPRPVERLADIERMKKEPPKE